MLDIQQKYYGIWSYKTSGFLVNPKNTSMYTFRTDESAASKMNQLNLDGRYEVRLINTPHLPNQDYVHPLMETKCL